MNFLSWFGGEKRRKRSRDSLAVENVETTEDVLANQTHEPKDNPVSSPTFQRPIILLLDMPREVAPTLRDKGYNVSDGSLGRPYRVEKESSLYPVQRSASLPQNYKEHDIVIIDLHYELGEPMGGVPEIADGVDGWFVSHKGGQVNPRLLNSHFVRSDFDRILDTGGVFLIYADSYEWQKFLWGHKYGYGNFDSSDDVTESNWGFLNYTAVSNYLQIGTDHGSSIELHDDLKKGAVIAQILSRHLVDAKYSCTLSPGYASKSDWAPLLVNKFGAAVAGAFVPSEGRKGLILILPQCQDKAACTLSIIDEFLPITAPHLFPETETAAWTNDPAYQMPDILELEKEIVELRQETQRRIESLQETIEVAKKEVSHIYDLARSTGDELVRAVHMALDVLGFANVVDVDADEDKKDAASDKREDLQVHGYDPTVIIEVKGISHYPSDDDSLVVQKYVVLRMKEWERVNVKGLSIINHQRHLPPLLRENKMPFREELVDAAREQDIGLLTGWELHKLVRSFLSNSWSHDQIKHIFFESGRPQILPRHYEYVGSIERYLEELGVVGIRLVDELKRGDRVAYDLPAIFKEELCNSIEHENEPIDVGKPGMLVGMKTTLSRDEARSGVSVFRLKSASH